MAAPCRAARAGAGARACARAGRGAPTRSRRSCCGPTSRTSSWTTRRAFLAYRVVGGVAIVSGDPIGPPECGRRARRRVRRAAPATATGAIAILGASERVAAAVRPARPARALPRRRGGRRSAVVLARGPGDPQGAAVGAPARPHAGYRAGRSAPERDRREAAPTSSETVAHAWRGDAPERGFVMALDALFGLERRARRLRRRLRVRTARQPGSCTSPFRLRGARCRCRRCRACATRRTASTSGSSAERFAWARRQRLRARLAELRAVRRAARARARPECAAGAAAARAADA